MFGLGWGEMVVIGIVALIAIGPKELPTVLRTIGMWMGKVRRMANEFQGQFQEALREAELTDLKKHADDIASDISNFDPMKDTQKEMEQALAFDDPLKDINTSLDAPAATATPAVADAALPAIDVPLPDALPPLTDKDFASVEPLPPPATQDHAHEVVTEPHVKSGTGT